MCTAFELYRKGSAGGNDVGTCNLALSYANGWVVDRDDEPAIELYRRACEGASADAMSDLGRHY